jgi:serine phosphatase RsbU (regulator of sigma subunit)
LKNLYLLFVSIILINQLNAQTAIDQNKLLAIAQEIYASNPDSSYSTSIEAEKISLQNNDTQNLIKAKSYIARYLLLKSELEEANKKLIEAESISRETNDTKGLAYVLKLKSILLSRIGNPIESTIVLEEAITLYRKTNDTTGLTAALLNISRDYINRKNFNKAEDALTEVENLAPSIQNQFYLHQNRGTFYNAKGEYDAAIKELLLGNAIAAKEKMIDSEATILKIIGSSYRLKKDYLLSEEFLLKSKAIAEQNSLDHELIETYDELILLYEDQGKFQESFKTLKLQNELKSKILNIEKINRITALEKKLALSQKEKEIQEAKSNTQKLFYVLIGIAFMLLFAVYMYLKTRSLKNKIANQHNKLEEKNIIIEEKNKDITDSIHYAKRIQEAILPSEDVIKQILPNSFIFYKPKDIVSGDFYWMERFGKQTIVAAVDCTGHGVPGAFMSIVGANLLNEAVNEHGITQPAAILNNIRKSLIKKLRKKNEDSSIKDGMDAALLSINEDEMIAEFAGAYNPLWIIRNNNLLEYKADKTPIGINQYEEDKPFNNSKIELQKGDLLYIFTDGYADQFGGSHGKKFKYKNLKELLLKIATQSLSEQAILLEKEFTNWKGELEQVDDVLIIGVKI